MSDTAQILDDAFDRLLSRRLSDAMDRKADGLPETLLVEVLDAGFARVLAPEEDGGLGGSMTDAANLAWRAGWHAAPLAIVEMLLLGHLDPKADLATVTLAHGTPAIAPALQNTRTIQTGDGAVDANLAQPFHHISGTAWVRLDGVAANHSDDTNAMGALLTTAAMVGAMARILEIATEHATTRTQFGRPLSKFQAIQHQLAEAASEVTLTEASLANALDAHDANVGRTLLWCSAKAQAGVASTKVAATAHQVMGAIGFTEDHELHHFTKLLWQWRDCWGRQADCEQAIGRYACAAEDGLWAYLTDKSKETI